MDLVIRRGEEKDIVSMTKLDELCFTVPWSQAAFSHELKENHLAFYLVGEIGGQVIGYAGMWKILDEGHITNVAVDPNHRKKGIGKAMVSLLIEVSKEEGIVSHTLEVRQSNQEAIDLYSKLGFEPISRRKNYYEDNQEDAIIMWRTE